MKKMKHILIVILAFICFNANAQNKACSGKEFTTDELFFRIYADGLSSDMTASKKKAFSTARSNIISLVNASAEAALKSQGNIEAPYLTKMIGLMQMAVRQEGANIKTICENSTENNGKFKSEVVVELSKEKLIKRITEIITNDPTLKDKFKSDTFKSNFK